jgi:coenzyme Q-binding protein COQ10
MATPRTLRPLLRGQPYNRPLRNSQRRTFFPNPFDSPLNPLNTSSTPQTLTATRTLPYPSQPIYSIVSDVASYSHFLPYCSASTVTRWSRPDPTYNRKWPSEAQLVIGFSNFTETFTSRVFCVPGRIVESIGGSTETDLRREEIAHHLEDGDKGAKGAGSGLMTHLRSRWTIEELGKDRTEVTLALEFAFANPLYTALSAGAAPKVADVMIKAFEERVRSLMERNPGMAQASLGELEGSSIRA